MSQHLIAHRFQENAAIKIAIKRAFAIIAEPGLGKTVITLRAIQIINPKRVLIIAPRLVAWNTWPDEINKWHEFNELKYTFIHTSYKTDTTAQIYLANPESLIPRLIQRLQFDMLVIDESTLFKNWRSLRFRRALKIAKHCKYRVTLTGNPIPKDYLDLWSQFKLIDFGESLYPKIGQYRTRYFNTVPKRVNAATIVETYELRPDMDKAIQTAIAPRCATVDAKGLISVPDLIIRDLPVALDMDEQTRYDMFEDELFAEIDGKELVSFSAGSKYVRCHQLANGACYDDDRNVLELHTKKIEMLASLVDELNGKPLLVAYRFKHDASRILTHMKRAKLCEPNDLALWNKGKIPIWLVQYQNYSRGLNLQDGGRNLACYSLTDNYDDYYQMIRRLYRQGATDKTMVHRIITKNTVDQVILNRLNRRQSVANDFIESLKAYRFMKAHKIKVRSDLPPRS